MRESSWGSRLTVVWIQVMWQTHLERLWLFFFLIPWPPYNMASDFRAIGMWNLMALTRVFFYPANICWAPATCQAFLGSRDTGEWAKVPAFMELTAISYTWLVCYSSQTCFITNDPMWFSSPLPESGGIVCMFTDEKMRQVQTVDIT